MNKKGHTWKNKALPPEERATLFNNAVLRKIKRANLNTERAVATRDALNRKKPRLKKQRSVEEIQRDLETVEQQRHALRCEIQRLVAEIKQQQRAIAVQNRNEKHAKTLLKKQRQALKQQQQTTSNNN